MPVLPRPDASLSGGRLLASSFQGAHRNQNPRPSAKRDNTRKTTIKIMKLERLYFADWKACPEFRYFTDHFERILVDEI